MLKKVTKGKHHFRIKDIQHDDQMIIFYTGFVSFKVFNIIF